jgi:hypothetical protein
MGGSDGSAEAAARSAGLLIVPEGISDLVEMGEAYAQAAIVLAVIEDPGALPMLDVALLGLLGEKDNGRQF